MFTDLSPKIPFHNDAPVMICVNEWFLFSMVMVSQLTSGSKHFQCRTEPGQIQTSIDIKSASSAGHELETQSRIGFYLLSSLKGRHLNSCVSSCNKLDQSCLTLTQNWLHVKTILNHALHVLMTSHIHLDKLRSPTFGIFYFNTDF